MKREKSSDIQLIIVWTETVDISIPDMDIPLLGYSLDVRQNCGYFVSYALDL